RKAVVDVGQRDPAIDGGRSWLQSEIEIFRLVDLLNGADVLRVEPRNVDEDVVVHQHAVAILAGGLGVGGERLELTSVERGAMIRVGIVGAYASSGRIPLEREFSARVGPEAVV